MVFGISSPALAAETSVMKPSPEKIMAQAIQEDLAVRMALPAELFSVRFENLTITKLGKFAPESLRRVSVSGVSTAQRPEGLFSQVVSGLCQEAHALALMPCDFQLVGILRVTGPVLVTTRTLARDAAVQKEDLRVAQMSWAQAPSGSLALSMNEVLGRSLRATLATATPIQREQLDDPMAVQRGEQVQVTVFAGEGVIVRSLALAKQDGRVGERIKVEGLETKKALQATVTGRRSVEVKL